MTLGVDGVRLQGGERVEPALLLLARLLGGGLVAQPRLKFELVAGRAQAATLEHTVVQELGSGGLVERRGAWRNSPRCSWCCTTASRAAAATPRSPSIAPPATCPRENPLASARRASPRSGFKNFTATDGSDLHKHLPRFQGENLGKIEQIRARVEAIAAAKKCSLNQLALAWVQHKGEDIVAIPWTTKIVNLDSNIDSLGVSLTKEEMEQLKAAVPIHKVLKGIRNKVQIATKFANHMNDDHQWETRGDPEYVRAACEASLKRLDVDYIDLYYQHRVDVRVPIEVTVKAMKELVEAGKVKYLGLSEANAAEICCAYTVHPITAVQLEYSLWMWRKTSSPPAENSGSESSCTALLEAAFGFMS